MRGSMHLAGLFHIYRGAVLRLADKTVRVVLLDFEKVWVHGLQRARPLRVARVREDAVRVLFAPLARHLPARRALLAVAELRTDEPTMIP